MKNEPSLGGCPNCGAQLEAPTTPAVEQLSAAASRAITSIVWASVVIVAIIAVVVVIPYLSTAARCAP